MDAEQIADLLGGKKRHGTGYMTRCPAHDDGKSSLSVRDGQKGVLFHCHAGCDQRDVLAALATAGVGAADLFLESRPPRPARAAAPERTIVATYDYVSADGELLFQAVRFDPKDFRQRRKDPAGGGWLWKLGDTPIVPFRLPELIACDVRRAVFVVEGEKDVLALAALGCVATCNPMGAGKWRDHFAEHFKGRTVVILPDNDEPGRKHAAQVWRNLAPVVARIRSLELPGLPEHGDVSDWIAAGGSREGLSELVQAALRVEQAPPSEPSPRPTIVARAPAPAAPVAPQPARATESPASAEIVDINARRKPREQGPEPAFSGRSWAMEMIVGDSGKIKPLLGNAITALRMDAEWRGCIAFDEFELAIKVLRDTPSGTRKGAQWSDTDDVRACCWLQSVGIHVRDNDAAKAINTVAHDNRVHPVRDYLESIAHDGRPRIDRWLTDYCGSTDTPLLRAFARRWLIGAVARIFDPGCQMDTALVFESDQGDRKSTAWRVLAGEWFTDDLERMGTREASLQTAGVWIIEIAELAAMGRVEVENVKAFLTRREDRVRAPYERRPLKHRRQCVFGGTVNPDGKGWIRDPTGGRRFWPVPVGTIDAARLALDRDQLWAEAVAAYHAGERWWIDKQDEPELWALSMDSQEDRRTVDEWESIITRYIHEQPTWTRAGVTWVRRLVPMGELSVGELLEQGFGIEPGKWSRADQMRVAESLKALRWERFRAERKGQRLWMYRKGSDGRDGVGAEKSLQNQPNALPSIPSQPIQDDTDIPF